MQINIISGGNVYRGTDVTPYVDELSRMHATALEMAMRANVGRMRSYERRRQWCDQEIDLRDADGAVLATVGVTWEGLTARVWLRQVAEPSFVFA